MFSYDDYRVIIDIIRASGRGKKYSEAYGSDDFVIMRHDVEYSVERAYDLSCVESEMGFTSTWFFQITNNTYNPFSRVSGNMIRKMREAGHVIGLHYALDGETDVEKVRRQIPEHLNVMSEMMGFKVDTFSIHRPPAWALAADFKYSGILNAYQDDFFTYAEDVGEDSELEVKYMSDANHIWRYGYPDENSILNHRKVQILTHPFAWTREGYDNHDNYVTLIREKYSETVHSVNDECKDFAVYLDEFLNAHISLEMR